MTTEVLAVTAWELLHEVFGDLLDEGRVPVTPRR
jgi:hypothetical protein